MRRARVIVAAFAVSLLIGASGGPSGAADAPGGALIAGPTTGLVDGQPILVAGTGGLAPNTTVHVYECRNFDGCESLNSSAVTDASGRFSTVAHVRRGLDDSGTPVDCAVTQCSLAVSSSTADAHASWSDMLPLPSSAPNVATVSLSFAVRPTVSVAQNRRLSDGQAVTLEGRDLVPGQTVDVYECAGLCTQRLPGSAVVDRNGRVSISTTVRRWNYDWAASGGDLPMDCSGSVPACFLTLVLRGNYEDGYAKLAGARLNFAPSPAIFTANSVGPGAFFGLGRVSTLEGDTGTHTVEIRFGVTPSSARPQVVHYRTQAWTAIAADFVPIQGDVTLPPGATEGSVTVEVRGDTEVEGDEAFIVEFRGARRLSHTRGFAVVVIQDDRDG